MKAISASCMVSDPYRAGVALGEALGAILPEVVFLFGSVEYFQTNELLDGLYDSLGRDDLVLIGNSGDGFYDAQRVSEVGVAALALNSEGLIRWHTVSVEGATADSAGAMRAGLQALEAAFGGEKPSLIFMVSDFNADGGAIQAVLRDETDIPVVGGFGGDDNRLETCFLCANRRILRDSIVLLGAAGPLAFDVHISRGLTPIGQAGRIDEVAGRQIRVIDGISAMDFIERETGKPILPTDYGFVTLAVREPEQPDQMLLRSIIPDFRSADGSIGLYTGIAPGSLVQVCLAKAENLIAEVDALMPKLGDLSFAPSAALIVSCAWRRPILGGESTHEVQAISQAYPGIAVAGFPSLGEIGPFKTGPGYARSLYHNMTCVVLLLGSRA